MTDDVDHAGPDERVVVDDEDTVSVHEVGMLKAGGSHARTTSVPARRCLRPNRQA